MIKGNKTVIISTVYKKITKYIPDFIHSLKNQTSKDFDILIANDDVRNLPKVIGKHDLNIEIIKSLNNPIKTRKKLIKLALKKNYKNIIFADADDICHHNRVEDLNKLLLKNKIVVNDINLMNNERLIKYKKYFSNRFKNNSIIDHKKIYNFNIFGLTNTGASASVLREFDFSNNDKIIAFDWYLWTSVLIKKNKAIFTNETSTNYRIYNNNIIGFPKRVNLKNFEFGLDVKLLHYKHFKNYNKNYLNLYNKFKLIKSYSKDPKRKKKYIKLLNKNLPKKQLWWEFISNNI